MVMNAVDCIANENVVNFEEFIEKKDIMENENMDKHVLNLSTEDIMDEHEVDTAEEQEPEEKKLSDDEIEDYVYYMTEMLWDSLEYMKLNPNGAWESLIYEQSRCKEQEDDEYGSAECENANGFYDIWEYSKEHNLSYCSIVSEIDEISAARYEEETYEFLREYCEDYIRECNPKKWRKYSLSEHCDFLVDKFNKYENDEYTWSCRLGMAIDEVANEIAEDLIEHPEKYKWAKVD